MNVAEGSWVDFEQQLTKTRLALVPVGAVEVYGPHMPQGTDGIAAKALCDAAAIQTPLFVAPLIPVGWSETLASFPGTMVVPTPTVKAYAGAIVSSLLRWGINRVVLVNGHLGNVPCLQELCLETEAQHPDCKVATIDIWRFIQPFAGAMLQSERWAFGHAGEAMTSVMLHLHPKLVHQDRLRSHLPEQGRDPLGVFATHRYRDQAPEGLLGDATLATAEQGKIIFDRTVQELLSFLDRFAA